MDTQDKEIRYRVSQLSPSTNYYRWQLTVSLESVAENHPPLCRLGKMLLLFCDRQNSQGRVKYEGRYVSSLRPAYASTRMLDERDWFFRNVDRQHDPSKCRCLSRHRSTGVVGSSKQDTHRLADDFHLVRPDFQLRAVSVDAHEGRTGRYTLLNCRPETASAEH